MDEIGLAGVLVLESEIFVCNPGWAPGLYLAPYYVGAWSLWGLSCSLSHFARALRFTSTSPEVYALSHLTMLMNIVVRFSPCPPTNLNLLELDWLRYSQEAVLQFADKLQEEGFLEHDGAGRVKLHFDRIKELEVLAALPLI